MHRACSNAGCGRPLCAKGLCRPCYRKAWAADKKDRLNEQSAAYYAANRAKVLADSAAWKATNAERRREVNAAWKADNKERTAETNRLWAKENRDRLRGTQAAWKAANAQRLLQERRARRAANAERLRAVDAEWRSANPEKLRAYKARYRALQMGAVVTAADYREILARDGMVCHICGDDIASRADLHFDHVIPLSKGGPHEPENIRPAHKVCNLRKGARVA